MVAPLGNRRSISELAQDILDHAPNKFALAGLSMGGIVAMEVFRQAPERINRIALLDTNPLDEPVERQTIRDQQILRAQNGELRAVIRDEMKPNYLTDGPHTGSILDLCMSMAETLGPDVFINQSYALQNRPNQCDTLRQIDVPTLILCGEDDALCPIERHQLMRDLIPGARLEVIPGAGHLPTLEQPQLTIEALQAWLDAPSSSQSNNG